MTKLTYFTLIVMLVALLTACHAKNADSLGSASETNGAPRQGTRLSMGTRDLKGKTMPAKTPKAPKTMAPTTPTTEPPTSKPTTHPTRKPTTKPPTKAPTPKKSKKSKAPKKTKVPTANGPKMSKGIKARMRY